MSFADALASATQAAVCGWLQNGGNQSLTTALVAGATVPGGQVPALAGGLGLLAMNYGCSYNPNGTTGDGSWSGSICTTPGGYTRLGFTGNTPGVSRQDLVVLDIGVRSDWPGWVGSKRNGIKYTYKSGTTSYPPVETSIEPNKQWIFTPDTSCAATGTPGLPSGGNPTYTYTDSVTSCTYVVEHLAWDVGSDGAVAPVVKISPGAVTLASGGVIGGCNFSPVLHYGGGGGGGGGPTFPWTPGPDVDGEPWWVPLIRGAAGGVAGAVTSKLLDAIFGEKTQADLYRLTSVCEVNGQGEPVSQSREVNLPAVPILNGIVARLDAMEVLLQGLKDFKQPICVGKKPTGELVTVNFNSHPAEVPTRQQVVKQLRYRDQSGRPESFHVDHWREFVWQTGPVIVTSRGAAWGVVQVWASTSDEGRRVINHAAAAAGVNLQVPDHRWETTSPKDPRYGREATVYPVKFDATGLVMVSKRDGASGIPIWMRDP